MVIECYGLGLTGGKELHQALGPALPFPLFTAELSFSPAAEKCSLTHPVPIPLMGEQILFPI